MATVIYDYDDVTLCDECAMAQATKIVKVEGESKYMCEECAQETVQEFHPVRAASMRLSRPVKVADIETTPSQRRSIRSPRGGGADDESSSSRPKANKSQSLRTLDTKELQSVRDVSRDAPRDESSSSSDDSDADDDAERSEGSKKPTMTPSNPWRAEDSKHQHDDASKIERGEAAAAEKSSDATKHSDKPAALTHAATSSVRVPASKKELVLTLIGLALALLMAALDNTIVGTALPKIIDDLGGSKDQYSWVVISYLLASTAFAPSYGRLSDLYGRRNVLFLVGSAMCGASVNMEMLIASRAIQGIGGGGLAGLAFVVIGDIVPPRDRGKYSGVLGGVFALASVVGPLAGGVLTDAASWRWCFYINMPLGVLAFIMLGLAFKGNKHGKDKRHIDVAGTSVMVVIVVLIEIAVSWGGDKYEWDNIVVILLLSIGGFLIVPFLFIERDAQAPIIPLRLFKNRNVTIACLAGFFSGMPMFIAFIFLPVWFQKTLGYTATSSGLQMLALMFSLIVFSIVAGGVMSKTGQYRPQLIIGTMLLPVGYGLVALLDESASQGLIIPLQLCIGGGIGLFLQILTTMAQNVVGLEDLAVVTTTVTFFRTVGASLGIAIFTAVLTNTGKNAAEEVMKDESWRTVAATPGGVAILQAHINSLAITRTFLYTLPLAILPFIIVLFTKNVSLRTTFDAPGGAAAH